MATQLNSDTYAVLAKRPGTDEVKEFHGTQDKRWHTVERAASLARAGWEIVDITGEDGTDVKGNQDLINRHNVFSAYATEHSMSHTVEQKGATPEKTMELSFEDQEVLALPLRNLTKLTNFISQQVLKGKKPVDSCNALASESLHTLRTLGVEPSVLLEAVKTFYPELSGQRKHRDEQ